MNVQPVNGKEITANVLKMLFVSTSLGRMDVNVVEDFLGTEPQTVQVIVKFNLP